MDYISANNCIDGGLYKVYARNFSLGMFDHFDQTFIGIRRKFHDIFLDKEIHWDTDDCYGTVKPIELVSIIPQNFNFHNYQNDRQIYDDLFLWLKQKRKEIETE